MIYTHCDDELLVKGEMLVDVEVTGELFHDDGKFDAYGVDGRPHTFQGPDQWHHEACHEVKLKMWDGKYRAITGPAALAIYEAFTEAWPARELAEMYK